MPRQSVNSSFKVDDLHFSLRRRFGADSGRFGDSADIRESP
jgi:hypothetical protein